MAELSVGLTTFETEHDLLGKAKKANIQEKIEPSFYC